MADKIIKPEQLEDAVKKLMSEYRDKALEIAESSAKSGARSSVRELKASPHIGKTGDYNSGWTSKTEGRNTPHFTVIVYNRKTPGLPHLLNNSHAVGRKRQGHYSGDGHIDRAEANGSNIYYDEVVKKL